MARQLKRRRKRKIEKQKKKGNLGEDANDDGEDEDGANSADLEWEHVAHVATSAKPRSLALRPSATLLPVAGARKRAGEVVNSQPSRLEMTVTLTNNACEMHELVADADPPSRRTKLVERPPEMRVKTTRAVAGAARGHGGEARLVQRVKDG